MYRLCYILKIGHFDLKYGLGILTVMSTQICQVCLKYVSEFSFIFQEVHGYLTIVQVVFVPQD